MIAIAFTVLFACKNRRNSIELAVQTEDTIGASTPYLPVIAILKSDKAFADSFATAYLRRIESAGKKDSAFITPEVFSQLASGYFLPELQDSLSFRQQFKESSVMDQSTELLTFIYTPKSPASGIQQVTVYVQPNDGNGQINRVYMERTYDKGDTVVKQKMTWKLKQYFYTITIKQPANGEASVTTEKVIWNPQLFQED